MTADVLLYRSASTDAGTFGDLVVRGKRFCFSLELPWRDNTPQLSCIPAGIYEVEPIRSPHFGYPIYHIKNVPNRSNVLQHSGCYAGDVTKGYKTHVLGCQLLGYRRGVMDGQPAIWNSRPAVSDFGRAMGWKPYTLEIVQC